MSGKLRNTNRRKILKHLGITIALPYLESIMGFLPVAQAQARTRQRFIGVFFSNGKDAPAWRYGNGGVLNPLETAGHRENVMILRGLRNSHPQEDTHMNGTAGMLSCSQVIGGQDSNGRYNLRCGESMDQVLAKHIAGQVQLPMPSLQLGWQYRVPQEIASRYHADYANCISWANATTPLRPQYSPSKVFDSMFAGSTSDPALVYIRQKEKSILDGVMRQSQELRSKLSNDDKKKLDEHLEQIRALEAKLNGSTNQCENPDAVRNNFSDTTQHTDHIRKMNELAVLAFQCDITRVITIMYEPSIEGLNERNGRHSVAHESVSNPNAYLADYNSHRRYTLTLWADLITRLKQKNLLESTLVVISSDMGHGAHSPIDLPVLVAGTGNDLRFGQEVGRADQQRPLASLYVDLMRMYGLNITRFGQAGNQGVGIAGDLPIFV